MSRTTALPVLGKVRVSGDTPAPGIIREGCQGGDYKLWKFLGSQNAEVIPHKSVWDLTVHNPKIKALSQSISLYGEKWDAWLSKLDPDDSFLGKILFLIWVCCSVSMIPMLMLLGSALILGKDSSTYLLAFLFGLLALALGAAVAFVHDGIQKSVKKRIDKMKEELSSMVKIRFPATACNFPDCKLIDGHPLKAMEAELEKFGAELGFERIVNPKDHQDYRFLWRVGGSISMGTINECYYLGLFGSDEITEPQELEHDLELDELDDEEIGSEVIVIEADDDLVSRPNVNP